MRKLLLAFLLILSIQSTCIAQWMPPTGDPPGDPVASAPPAEHSIAWVKSLPDGAVLTDPIIDKVVTRTFPEFGYFYIQELGFSFGMRVKAAACPNPGDVITITSGTLKTVECQRYIDNASYTVSEHNHTSKPVGMTNKTVGGGDFLYEAGPPIIGQQGFWDGAGLNNIGMLIRTWGKVVEVDVREKPLYYFIDDGSGVDMAVDLEVAPGQSIPFNHIVGDYVIVDGISSCLPVDGWPVRVLRPSAPTAKLTKAVGQSDPASKGPIKFSATFSEPVEGFINSDVRLTGTAHASSVNVLDSGDHMAFTIEVSGMSVTGTVGVRLDYGAAKSVYYEGESLATSTLTVNYSAYAPYRTINKRMGVGGTGRFQRKPLK